MNYIDYIPFDGYVTREQLAQAWGVSDRMVRHKINEIRKSAPENVIISSSDHKGYKRPSSYAEIEKCLEESRKKVQQEFAKQKQLMFLLKNKDQRALGVV